ncbi:MAG: cyclic peptide export ABC transporter [Kofleriaceae bacterium]
MKSLLLLLRERRGYVVAAALVGVLGGAANARLISLVNDELAVASRTAGALVFFLSVVAFSFLTGLLSEAMLVFLSERLSHHLRVNLCGQILRKPLAEVERLGSSRLTAAFTQDIPTIGLALLRIPTVFINGAITLGCLSYLGFLSPIVLGGFAVFLVVGLISYVVPEQRAMRYLTASRQAWDLLLGGFDAMNRGAKELKLNYRRRQAFFSELRDGPAERVRQTAAVQRVIYALLSYWAHALFFLFVAALLFAAPAYTALSLKTLTGFAIVTLYLVGPIDQLTSALPRFRAADVAFTKLRQLGLQLDASAAEVSLLEVGTDGDASLDIPEVRELSLHAVTHSYYREKEERDFLLGPIDLTIPAGELVLVTGGNGSGKTTLAKLLVGLYAPASGECRLNGEPITDANRERYRQCFSAVFSDFHVFDQLPAIADGALDERALGYLQKLHLDHKVTVKDGRLSTTALSTGQRKRLALLVAYLEDRPIYLFDEWAADQDPEFKEVFYHHLLPELRDRGKTVLAITHDDRYFDIADRLLKLRDGQLELVRHPQAAPPPLAEHRAAPSQQPQQRD